MPWAFRPHPGHPGWEARYAALVPLLAGEPRVAMLREEGDAGVHRLFRAQFVLAPSVIEPRSRLDDVVLRQLHWRPLILDFRSASALEGTLREIESRGAAIGMEIAVERRAGQIAVVRSARRQPR